MARPIVLSNGELHVGINHFGLVHDFFYPYVGLENHTIGQGLRHKVGVWIDGQISWLDDGGWDVQFSYPHMALVGHVRARSDRLNVILEFDDAVDCDLSAFMRNIHVVNLSEERREIRLFMHQAFVIGDSRSNTDTGRFLPDSHALVHYRGRRVFVISGETNDGQPFDQYAVGLFGIEGHEGTWRDAEDGELGMGAVEHGRVDSTIRFCLNVEPRSSARVHYWIACGTSMRDALFIHKTMKEDSVLQRQHATANWWHTWLGPTLEDIDKIPRRYRDLFVRSAMVVKSHIDKHGAVIASTDSAMLNYNRDAYAYCWPRDGAYAVWPLIRLGYRDEAIRFFDFCRRGLHPAGYLAHKYRADGALGSSWHSYLHESGIVAPPIQEDETAITLFVFAQYYHMHPSEKLLREYYESFVRPMANFLAEYVDPQTNLPKPSYDLWEEHFMVSTYTTAVTYAALLAAAELAVSMNDQESVVSWRAVAEDIYESARAKLYDSERGYLLKGLVYSSEHDTQPDATLDMASVFGAYMFGLFAPDSPEIESTMDAVERHFHQTETIGLPRYDNDAYRRVGSESNLWHITTLWLAEYKIERGDIAGAEKLIDWVTNHAFGSGVLSEQIFPDSGYSTSVAPLTWSHAEYMATILDLIGRRDEIA